jgi:hypothetical protein
MGDRSTIEWTEATWNPVTGCDRVSPGCDHCYALTLAARLKSMGQPKYQRDGDPRTSGPGFGVTLHPDELQTPRQWRRPRQSRDSSPICPMTSRRGPVPRDRVGPGREPDSSATHVRTFGANRDFAAALGIRRLITYGSDGVVGP